MPKHGKNYKNSLAQIEKGKVYTAGEAVELLKKITFESSKLPSVFLLN